MLYTFQVFDRKFSVGQRVLYHGKCGTVTEIVPVATVCIMNSEKQGNKYKTPSLLTKVDISQLRPMTVRNRHSIITSQNLTGLGIWKEWKLNVLFAASFLRSQHWVYGLDRADFRRGASGNLQVWWQLSPCLQNILRLAHNSQFPSINVSLCKVIVIPSIVPQVIWLSFHAHLRHALQRSCSNVEQHSSQAIY